MKFTLLLTSLALSCGTLLGQVAQPILYLRDFTASTSETITWTLPQASQPIQWRSVPSSFTEQGIRTFVAQLGGRPVGSLAVSSTGEVAGSLSLNGEYRLVSDPKTGSIHLLPQAPTPQQCGIQAQEAFPPIASSFRATEGKPKPVFSDGYFHTLRLAVLLSSNDYESELFQRDNKKIETWLAGLEAMLNSIYTREAGIHFTIVKNQRLYNTGIAKEYLFPASSTGFINERIGSDAYDVGISLAYRGDGPGLGGQALLYGLSIPDKKGNAFVSVQDYHAIAHEVGHLLGGVHTYGKKKSGYETGGDGDGSEPGSGTSIMSYGQSYDGYFLSLSTLRRMVTTFAWADKYLPAESKHLTSTNTPPVIDRTKMKEEYIVPRGTFFSIPVYASDKEQKILTYSTYEEGGDYSKPVHFLPISPQHSSRIEYYRRYGTGLSLMPNTDEVPVGTYRIRLAVNDGLPYQEAIEKRQAPLYDSYLATVRVVDVAKPFKMTEGLRSSYQAGEKFTLKWDVDPVFFKERKGKVRILFSSDRGKTFQPLVSATANDGECEVILPLQPLGWEYTFGQSDAMNKGLLRIETIDDGYFDISPNSPKAINGQRQGIELRKTAITFSGLPSTNYLQLPAGTALPDKPSVTASSGDKALQVTFEETTEDHIVRRLWSATDGAETAHFAQYIEHQPKEEAPTPEAPKEKPVTPPAKPEEPQPAQPEAPKEDPVTPPAKPEEPNITPIEEASLAPSFQVRFEGEQLLLSGTKAGEKVFLWDFSGKLLRAYPTTDMLTILPVPASPLFLVQIGKEVLKVRRP